MRLLVCGSRDFTDSEFLVKMLNDIDAIYGVKTVIEGEAPGADTLARMWAEANKIEVERYPADWKHLGRAAGPIRNRKMLDEGKPDLVVAFPKTTLANSKGTANMVTQARARDFTVQVFESGESAKDQVAIEDLWGNRHEGL